MTLFLDLPLPDPDSLLNDTWTFAYPEILKFTSALIGVTLTLLLVKSFFQR